MAKLEQREQLKMEGVLTVHFSKPQIKSKTVKFQEEGDESTIGVGVLYVNKDVLSDMGNPQRLEVTLVPVFD